MDGSTLGERRATMTFNAPADEMAALRTIARQRGITKTAALRQALAVYRALTERSRDGDRIAIVARDGSIKTELLLP